MNAVALQSFGFGEQLVRVIDRDGGIWFVAKDVCSALEIGNSRQAVSRLADDERDGVTISDAMGRFQETAIVSESGLYALIFRSRKPIAVQFRKWVTGDVLPAIRKTGRYEAAANDESAPLSVQPVLPDDFERLRIALKFVREARLAYGRAAARRAWVIAGLPPMEDLRMLMPPAHALVPHHVPVRDWIESKCEIVAGHREKVGDLHRAYAQWADARGLEAVGRHSFGRALSALGFEKLHSSCSVCVGVKVKD